MPMAPLATDLSLAKQAIKTAVAGIASLYITSFLKLPEGYWAAISALIVMQSSVGATVSASRTRLAGTAVGALVGGAFVAMLGTAIPWFAIGVALAFFLCSILQLAESQRLATVTVAIIMLSGRATSPWVLALHRFTEVSIGIVIALVVSLVLWPSRARSSLRHGLEKTLTELEGYFRDVSRSYRSGLPQSSGERKNAVDLSVRRNEDLLRHALSETFGLSRSPEFLALLLDRIEGIQQSVESLELAVQGGTADKYIESFYPQLDRVEEALAAAFEWLAFAVAERHADRSWPMLAESVAGLERKIVEARNSEADAEHRFEEILRFYSYFLSLKNLAQEMERTYAFVNSRRGFSTA